MDLVTQNLMAAFKAEESLPEKMDDATVLEHFRNFRAVSIYNDFSDLHTGGADDLGIDGIAVIRTWDSCLRRTGSSGPSVNE